MLGVLQQFSKVHLSKVHRPAWRRVVVSLAILAIALSVATRNVHEFSSGPPSAQAFASHAMRQHLAADAVELTNPVLPLAEMLLPVAAPQAPPLEAPAIHSFDFSEALYNRPPPALFLFQ